MPVYAIMSYSHSGGDEPPTACLSGAFSTFDAACDFLSSHDYTSQSSDNTYWEWGWGTTADIIEIPIDGEVTSDVFLSGRGCWISPTGSI